MFLPWIGLGRAENGRSQAVCKPGSVPMFSHGYEKIQGGDHSSGAAVTLLPRCDLPGRRPEDWVCRRPLARLRLSSLPGLAPGGVCHAGAVASPAVGSYPTLSPLPRTEARGGLLSVALSLRLPSPAVSRHRVSVEPGLSSPRERRAAARPPDSLPK